MTAIPRKTVKVSASPISAETRKKAREILDMMGSNPLTIDQRLTRLEKIFGIKKKGLRLGKNKK